MQDYKKLQDLNLREVSANTQIEMAFFEALLEKDFKALMRFNVKGFIKILEREYELDFTEFNEELEQYLNENQPDSSLHTTKTVTPPLASYSHKSSILPIVIIVLLALVVGAGIYYFDTVKELLKSEENISNAVSLDVVKETELNLQSLENSVVVVGEENLSQNEIDTSNVSVKVEEKVSEEVVDTNESAKTASLLSENNATSEPSKLESESQAPNALREFAVFKVNGKVWVGLINLQSGKKVGLVKESDFNISLNENQLILTGATAFVVSDEEGKEQSYPAGNSKRFLVQNGKITSISAAEFKNLNKGKDW